MAHELHHHPLLNYLFVSGTDLEEVDQAVDRRITRKCLALRAKVVAYSDSAATERFEIFEVEILVFVLLQVEFVSGRQKDYSTPHRLQPLHSLEWRLSGFVCGVEVLAAGGVGRHQGERVDLFVHGCLLTLCLSW